MNCTHTLSHTALFLLGTMIGMALVLLAALAVLVSVTADLESVQPGTEERPRIEWPVL